jgi:hypothetical protein
MVHGSKVSSFQVVAAIQMIATEADSWSYVLLNPPIAGCPQPFLPKRSTFAGRKIIQTIETVQKAFVNQMKFPDGIALNEALCS